MAVGLVDFAERRMSRDQPLNVTVFRLGDADRQNGQRLATLAFLAPGRRDNGRSRWDGAAEVSVEGGRCGGLSWHFAHGAVGISRWVNRQWKARSMHEATVVPAAIVLAATRTAPVPVAAILGGFYVPKVAQVQFAHQALEHGSPF